MEEIMTPEEGLISSVLNSRRFTPLVKEKITVEFFHAHREEADFIFRYVGRYRRVPSVKLFSSKFPDFALSAVQETEHYCAEVRERHATFLLVDSLSAVQDCLDEGEVKKALELMEKTVRKISPVVSSEPDVDIVKDWEQSYRDVKNQKEKYDRDGLSGIPTSFETVDEVTGGFKPGQLWVVAARTGEGKSISLVKMAVSVLTHHGCIQFNSLEMSRREVSSRVWTFLSGSMGNEIFVNSSLSQGKSVDLTKFRRFLRKVMREYTEGFHVYVPDRDPLDTLMLESQIQRNSPDIVVIDYLELMQGGSGDWMEVGRVVNWLKQFAIAHGVTVVLASQLNREAAGKLGGLHNLSQSDAVGKAADVVLIQTLVSDHAMHGYVAKNRNGKTGDNYFMEFDPERGKYADMKSYESWLRIKDADMARKQRGMR